MSRARLLLGLASGVALGAVLVVACSDDSPQDADAAICDCPAAEPPLAGRIVSVRGGATPINAGGGGGALANCPLGATILGGSCEVTNDDANVLLSESRFIRTGGSSQQFACKWSALNATVANTGVAEAICLVPAP
jgi:hypothetical protein